MRFRVIGKVEHVKTFAAGNGIREISRLRQVYGKGRWRKRKGVAAIQFDNGIARIAKLHWYEAGGIGSSEYKIKRFLD